MFFRQIFDISVAEPLNVRSVKSKKYRIALQILSVAALLLMLGMQIYTIRNHYLLLASDSFRYNDLAWNAYKAGTWYPSEINLCDSYIFGNGLVNLFIVLIKLTGSIEIIKYINIVFTYVILFRAYTSSEKLSAKRKQSIGSQLYTACSEHFGARFFSRAQSFRLWLSHSRRLPL